MFAGVADAGVRGRRCGRRRGLNRRAAGRGFFARRAAGMTSATSLARTASAPSLTRMTTSALTLAAIGPAQADRKSVIRQVDITVARGEWLALLGPNGSGKTTLLHCAAGLHAPSAGDVTIAGHSLKQAPREAKRHLGFALCLGSATHSADRAAVLEIMPLPKTSITSTQTFSTLADEFRYHRDARPVRRVLFLGNEAKLAVLLALSGRAATHPAR